MPPRPASPTARDPGGTPGAPGRAATASRGRRRPARGRIALRFALLGLGIFGGLSLLSLVWPKPDAGSENQGERTIADLAKPPNRAVTVLVIGLDSDELKADSNRAAPPGPANADALLLLRINPEGPLQVLALPTSVAVKIPGRSGLQSLGSLYRLGGIALTADATRDLLGLGSTEPDRYLVLSRGALRSLVDELGSLEVNPPQTMQYSDKRQGLTINIQGGLQRLKGSQIEHLLRYRDPGEPLDSRLANQEAVIRSLINELRQSGRGNALPNLVASLKPQVESNLTPPEVLSLMAAALAPGRGVTFKALPLEPPRPAPQASGSKTPAGQELRELAKSAPKPLWPAPAPDRPQS